MKKISKPAASPKYHHGDLREAILKAALQLVGDAGVQNLSLREIARKLGVTTAAPYHHFKDRDALLVEIARRGYNVLLRTLESARGEQRTGAEEVEAAARGYWAFAREHSATYDVMFSGEVAKTPGCSDLIPTADRCFALIAEAVAKAAGLAPREAAEAGLCVWSMVHGMVVLDRSNLLRESPSEQERIAVEGVLGVISGFGGRADREGQRNLNPIPQKEFPSISK